MIQEPIDVPGQLVARVIAAPNLPWTVFGRHANEVEARLVYGLDLPDAQMRFRRSLCMRDAQTTLYFSERTINLMRIDSPFCCQQHVRAAED